MRWLVLEAGDAATWGSTVVTFGMACYAIAQGVSQRRDLRRQNELQAEASQLQRRQIETSERRALAMEQLLTQLTAASGPPLRRAPADGRAPGQWAPPATAGNGGGGSAAPDAAAAPARAADAASAAQRHTAPPPFTPPDEEAGAQAGEPAGDFELAEPLAAEPAPSERAPAQPAPAPPTGAQGAQPAGPPGGYGSSQSAGNGYPQQQPGPVTPGVPAAPGYGAPPSPPPPSWPYGPQTSAPMPFPPYASPSDPWRIERVGRHGFALRNTGTATLTGVRVSRGNLPDSARGVPEESVVRPGEAVEFLMAAERGQPVPGTVVISWDGQPAGVHVPVPPA